MQKTFKTEECNYINTRKRQDSWDWETEISEKDSSPSTIPVFWKTPQPKRMLDCGKVNKNIFSENVINKHKKSRQVNSKTSFIDEHALIRKQGSTLNFKKCPEFGKITFATKDQKKLTSLNFYLQEKNRSQVIARSSEFSLSELSSGNSFSDISHSLKPQDMSIGALPTKIGPTEKQSNHPSELGR